MKKLIASLLLSVSGIVSSQTLVPLFEVEDVKFSIVSNSFRLGENHFDEKFVLVVGQMETGGVPVTEQWYVTIKDCQKGSGRLVTLGTDSEYKSHNDMTFDDGTVAGALSTIICGYYKRVMTRKQT